MRRGTRGHVALPHGQARAPAWRGCDMWRRIFIFIYIVYDDMYIGLPIIGRHFINPQCRQTLYSRYPFISSVWDYCSFVIFISGRRGKSRASDLNQQKSRAVDARLTDLQIKHVRKRRNK